MPKRIAILVAILPLVAILLFVDLPLCPTATVFHIPCPGCGLTRATRAAVSGEFREAFRYHPLVFVFVPLLSAYAITGSISFLRFGSAHVDLPFQGKFFDTLWLVLLAALIVLWIARFFGAFGGPVPV